MSRAKLAAIYLLLLAITSLLIGRLGMMQIFEGQYYRAMADENRIQLSKIKADRGIFYDRSGEVLVRNAPGGREYLLGEAASQLLGYAAEVDETELEQWQIHDIVGKMGLEKQYDSMLRGEDGSELFEKDTLGQKIREIGRKEPISGENLTLTIDSGLQREAYKSLKQRKGAVVMSDPKTGEILALVSSPGFKPDQLEKYLNDKNLPLFNRAIGGEYPPGSVFKIITAAAALEEGKISGESLIEDTGVIKVGDYSYSNWYFTQYGRKEGKINIVRALARSNDIFFYKLGEELGMGLLADWGKYFGVGAKTKIDLPGEASGLMPDPAWKKSFWGENWYLGDTYIAAIGQGNVLMTPLQVNQMASVIANNGKLCRPKLLKDAESACQPLDIHANTIELIKEGMKQVTETGGTAWPFFDFKVKGQRVAVAGKTGTAEFGEKTSAKGGLTHAWFTGFTPLDGPQIVVTVLLEAAGEGSYQAAPVAKELLQYWLERQ